MTNKLDDRIEAASQIRQQTKGPLHERAHTRLVDAGYTHRGGGEYSSKDGCRAFIDSSGHAEHFVAERA